MATLARTLEDSGDPRNRNGFDDRHVMNDRTKPEASGSPSIDPAKAKIGAPAKPTGWDETTARAALAGRRARPSEPYLTWLGQSLRQSYEETLNEPVPEPFRELLNRLEQQDEDKPSS